MLKILYILKTGIQWCYLKCKSHYTTIYKKFICWSNLDVFGKFFSYNLDLYIKYRNNNKLYFKDLYIDASHTKNIKGSDKIGRNHYDRFRNSTKSHIIIDENKVPLSFNFTPGNCSDCNLTEELVKSMPILSSDKRRRCNLIADKGYISEETYTKLLKNRICLIYPLRKNAKNKNKYSKQKKIKLKNRYLVEFFFNDIDKKRRILNRYERYCKHFISYNVLAFNYFILKEL